jgi:lipopolysaccharide transport system ATP-binding protein
MPSDDIAISARNLSKTYRIFGHPGDRIKQAVSFGLKKFHRQFAALTDVSFEIPKGHTVGIIGRNGSGKSTLLQLVCGILKPTSGTVRASGRVSALLELGAGFNPEFTGRENVYFQGALMGITKKEMDKRFDDITEFADIGEYVEQPVRTYSSGMFVRLAFAVATSTDPTILIVDEALSVGDIAFQHKCRKKMQDLTNSGVTLLVVSHDRMTITALCDRCILLDQGKVLLEGLPSDVFDYYHALLAAKGDQQVSKLQLASGRLQVVSGTGEARVESIRLLDAAAHETRLIEVGEDVVLEFVIKIHRSLPRLVLGFSVRDGFGQTVFGTNTNSFGTCLEQPDPGGRYRFRFSFRATIGAGSYSISTALVSTNDRFTNNYECRELAYLIEVRNRTHPAFGGVAWLNPELAVELL